MRRSASSVSRWEATETYSPAAIDMAPATSPAMPAVRTASGDAPLPATPTMMAAVDTTPSLAPRTAARSHPARCERCDSTWWWWSDGSAEPGTEDEGAIAPACHR